MQRDGVLMRTVFSMSGDVPTKANVRGRPVTYYYTARAIDNRIFASGSLLASHPIPFSPFEWMNREPAFIHTIVVPERRAMMYQCAIVFRSYCTCFCVYVTIDLGSVINEKKHPVFPEARPGTIRGPTRVYASPLCMVKKKHYCGSVARFFLSFFQT